MNKNMSQKFQRKIENFICEHCGQTIKGNGYTNHCPFCLWCKHVDINPGDRAETCGGLMEPINIESKKCQYIVIARCQKCGIIRKNKTADDDDFQALLKIAQKNIEKQFGKK
ncbi:MAG: RNHCP domain-containing protein [Patescibacteria group bacterium]|jgi:hypothetical protein